MTYISELGAYIAQLLAQKTTGVPNTGAQNVGATSPISVVPRSTINNAAPVISDQQVQAAAAGTVVGFGYGRCRVGIGILSPVVGTSGQLLIPGVVGAGPIDAIETVTIDDEALPSGVTYTGYTGTTTQTANADLIAAWNRTSIVYADTMHGTAYIVLSIPADSSAKFGNINVVARMLKVYDSRLDSTNGGSGAQRLADPTTWTWSQNPVLALAHFLSTPGIGPEETLDWSTVATCADIADQQLTSGTTTQTRRQLGIFFDRQQDVGAIESTLRSYAGVFVVREDDKVRLIADAPASVVYAFTNAAPANYLLDSLDITSRGRDNSPTVVTIKWTDTAQKPWATQEVTVKTSGVDAGTTPWVESVIEWPGCQQSGMAYREAVRRINEFNLADTAIKLTGTDDVLRVRRGDVVSVTDSEGFSAKPFRVTDVFAIGPGRWSVAASEYQSGLYSDTVYTGPVIPDSALPSPWLPPTPTGLTLTEEVYQERGNGRYASRVKITWDASTWPFVRQYQVTVKNGAAVIDSAMVAIDSAPEYRTPSMQEAITYTVTVAIVSVTGTPSATPASSTIEVLGTKLIPGDVPSVNYSLVSGIVTLTWAPAVDIDITGYEVRYGTTSATWETAALLDRPDGLSIKIPSLPVGTWRHFVKARDSIRSATYPYGQYSATAAYVDIVITATDVLSRGNMFASASLVNMLNVTVEGGAPRWVGSATTHVFSSMTPFVATQTTALALDFPGDGTGVNTQPTTLTTEWFDTGASLLYTVQPTVTISDLGNANTKTYIDFSNDGSTVLSEVDATGQTYVVGTGRYLRVKIDNTSTAGNGPCPLITNYPSLSISASGLVAAMTMKLNATPDTAPAVDSTAGSVRSFLALEPPVGAL